MLKKTLALTLTALTLCMVLSGCSDSTAGAQRKQRPRIQQCEGNGEQSRCRCAGAEQRGKVVA